ncbi:mediator of RNA polymerase II transcription subunit 6-like [Pollicipes pollicipes]|uniref:mediator of RNA polymerase II transcription subunit 6-like n=1 Tax=Pollicipes pollicipes TaxID=41117 RepID=UPI0018858A8B|nr:mediator of RNA polymerase II transcription subunit 6-like [Pollicipes pollicipes]
MVDQRDALGTSWHDSTWIPILSANNVMDYFAERTNPFYDRTCNNEVIKMQRINPDHLHNLVGLEYTLLHVQEPILYVIRKEHRHSPNQVTPLADYYVIAGKVYQVPDLGSVINSRLTSAINHLQEAFEEARSFSRYHPSKGYTFEFKSQNGQEPETKKRKKETEKELGSVFQTQRVDMLLADLARRFPPKVPQQPPPQPPDADVKAEPKQEKTESVTSVPSQASEVKAKAPPEKKPRLG